MGHKISREQIDPRVKDEIMSLVGDISELETEVNSDIISAVNSLIVDRVDNIESMGKIANAVGNPLDSNDSVNGAVNKLNELLSTFKTNMMKNGVTVESGDKFKALIDKIATLSDSEGKGLQFASGNISETISHNVNASQVFTNLNFTPTYIFVFIKNVTTVDSENSTNVVVSNLGKVVLPVSNYSAELSITNITNESFKLSFYVNYYTRGSLSGVSWYAIGVGEEDTTLRDSLANILGDKGVEVSPEDDMATLIGKVDGMSISSLDIISATSLPATGKENQICVITDNPTDKFLFTSIDSDFNTINDDTIIIHNSAEVTTNTYNVINGNFTSKYEISKFIQSGSTIPSYRYSNNNWVEFTPSRIYWIDSGKFTTDNELMGGTSMPSNSYVKYNSTYKGISFSTGSTTYESLAYATSRQKVDLSSFNKAYIKYHKYIANGEDYWSAAEPFVFYTDSMNIGQTNNATIPTSASATMISDTRISSVDGSYALFEAVFDLSKFTGTKYMGIGLNCSGNSILIINTMYFY